MSVKNKNISRREMLLQTLASAGGLGLQSFLLGLPPAFLSRRAMAETPMSYLIYCCSGAGEAVNANAPGSYVPGVRHPADFTNPVSFNLGSVVTQAAAPWANLPADLRERLHFIHYNTQTNSHAEAENVLRVQGDLKSESGRGQEMLPSAIAQINSPGLQTLNKEPALVGDIGSSLTYNTIPQPIISPNSIQNLFTGATSLNETRMQAFRDQAIDQLYSDLKNNGTVAQKRFLDNHANSAAQSRALAGEFVNTLNGIGVNNENDQMITAAALVAANVSPVAVVKLSFGGDGHRNGSDVNEVNSTNRSLASIATLWDRLKALGIADQTTFCLQGGVFGRTLHSYPTGWRNHNGAHTVAVLFGANVKPGVTGGIDLSSGLGEGKSSAINSMNGSTLAPDVGFTETLAATSKTLMKVCGIDESTINQRISKGKILRSVVR